MPTGTYGGVRGWGREAPAYSIQEKWEEPPPQDEAGAGEADSEAFEKLEQQDIIFSGPFSPQEGHLRPSPLSLIFWITSKTFAHFRHRYS
jgi:hypothetical protein